MDPGRRRQRQGIEKLFVHDRRREGEEENEQGQGARDGPPFAEGVDENPYFRKRLKRT